MDPSQYPIPPADYATIAEHVPIVSIDLLVRHGEGILLGKRTNEPAKGAWFVPGGTMLKGETRREAAHRIAEEELGVGIAIEDRLGTFEHFYEAAAAPGVSTKQYLATAYVVRPRSSAFETDDQHEAFRVASRPFDDAHEYVLRYARALEEAGYI